MLRCISSLLAQADMDLCAAHVPFRGFQGQMKKALAAQGLFESVWANTYRPTYHF